jgi:DNA-binding MarR family transcriptional regulator
MTPRAATAANHPSRARLANEVWESLLGAHAALMRQFAEHDVWQDLTMREYDVLYTLSKCTGPVSLATLNRHVLLSQPALSRMVDRLVERGLIRRERSVEDGRSVGLSLSAAGAELQRHVGLGHGHDVARAVSSRLDRGEMETLVDLCRRLATPAGVTA